MFVGTFRTSVVVLTRISLGKDIPTNRLGEAEPGDPGQGLAPYDSCLRIRPVTKRIKWRYFTSRYTKTGQKATNSATKRKYCPYFPFRSHNVEKDSRLLEKRGRLMLGKTVTCWRTEADYSHRNSNIDVQNAWHGLMGIVPGIIYCGATANNMRRYFVQCLRLCSGCQKTTKTLLITPKKKGSGAFLVSGYFIYGRSLRSCR